MPSFYVINPQTGNYSSGTNDAIVNLEAIVSMGIYQFYTGSGTDTWWNSYPTPNLDGGLNDNRRHFITPRDRV